MAKEYALPPTCAAEGCSKLATLIHRNVPFCGKHALEQLESGEPFETPANFGRALFASKNGKPVALERVATVNQTQAREGSQSKQH